MRKILGMALITPTILIFLIVSITSIVNAYNIFGALPLVLSFLVGVAFLSGIYLITSTLYVNY